MSLIKSTILPSLGALISISSLTLPLASSSFATPGVSHKQIRMCAKIQYTYRSRRGGNRSNVTPERCGRKFKQIHGETAMRRASRREACKAAWKELPKLQRGDRWLRRSCKPSQRG